MKKGKGKKILLGAVALVLVAAIGVGIFLGTRGSGNPVNVYPFDFVGMTDYYGDSNETYGPVSTDKIQTVYLSTTQTVTEVLVAEGDEVKQGDVLMTFDTTLTELELERKRLDVEKQKLDLETAENQLYKIKTMVPMDPDAINNAMPQPTEPDLGEKITGEYEISQKTEYDGSAVEKYLILWLKDGKALNSDVLRLVRQAAAQYQLENMDKPASSASNVPDVSDGEQGTGGGGGQGIESGGPQNGSGTENGSGPQNGSGTENGSGPQNGSGTENGGGPQNGSGTENGSGPQNGSGTENGGGPQNGGGTQREDTDQNDANAIDSVIDDITDTEEMGTVTVTYVCNNQTVETQSLEVGPEGYQLGDAYTYNGKTYWLSSAKGANGGALETLRIPAYPQDDSSAQAAWEATWSSVTLNYIRDITIACDKAEDSGMVQLTPGKEANLCFSVYMKDAPAGGSWKWTVTPTSGEDTLTATSNGSFLILSGEPGEPGDMTRYEISALYTFADVNGQQWAVEATFAVSTLVGEEEQVGKPVDDFYMVLKVTEDDMSRGNRLIWQGLHVFCYADGSYGFSLFDAGVLEDHTLEPLDDEEPTVPDIDFGSGYTAVEIAKMRVEQEKAVRQQQLALDMAQAEYNLMQAEVNDGKVCADFDGQVVSVLDEEEARTNNTPLLKVSAGGGYYVEGSVSELQKDLLQIGQEVTINDWNTGSVYTGTVDSIADFPVEPNGWSSADNPNVSFYPFTAFVDSSADLQAGNYVSMTYSTTEGGNGVYLQSAFLRTEGGRSYVFVKGENGSLEKRYVTVGKSLWGSYTQVLSGVTAEDYLAFPYGKDVKDGAPAVETDDLSSLYGY